MKKKFLKPPVSFITAQKPGFIMSSFWFMHVILFFSLHKMILLMSPPPCLSSARCWAIWRARRSAWQPDSTRIYRTECSLTRLRISPINFWYPPGANHTPMLHFPKEVSSVVVQWKVNRHRAISNGLLWKIVKNTLAYYFEIILALPKVVGHGSEVLDV